MIVLYKKNETDFTHNGLMILQPIEAVVTEEINGDYSLKLTMPRGFSEIENEQIIKVPTPKTDQLFRVYNPDANVLNTAPTTLEKRPLEVIQAAFLLYKNIN